MSKKRETVEVPRKLEGRSLHFFVGLVVAISGGAVSEEEAWDDLVEHFETLEATR